MAKNTALAALSCGYNRLTSLNVTNNTALVELYCSGNQLTTEELNALFGSLPGNTGDKTINIGDNLGAATCNRTIATDKGWTVRN